MLCGGDMGTRFLGLREGDGDVDVDVDLVLVVWGGRGRVVECA